MSSTPTDRIDGLSTSVAVKAPCTAVELSNITLAGLQGYTEGDRVLCVGQTSAVENGIYNASTGSWTRTKDFDGNRDVVQGTRILVAFPDSSPAAEYEVTTANPIVIGTTALTFTLRYGANATYNRTDAEIAAAVVPANYAYLPGNVLRYGASPSASASVNSAAFQAAFDSNSRVFCDFAGTYVVNTNLVMRASQSLDLGKGVTIQGAPSIAWGDSGILQIVGVNNVRVFGGTIDGNKANNPNGRAYGVHIENARDVQIYGTRCINCPQSNLLSGGGDGFYIAGDSTEIEIYGAVADGNARQGLSAIQGERIRIIGGSFINTSGSAPGAGIDLEPDSMLDTLRDISIIGATFSGNERGIICTVGAKFITIAGCTFKNNRGYELGIGDGCDSVTVNGNTFSAGASTAGSQIVRIVGADDVVFSGNTIAGSNGADETSGITVEDGCNRVSVVGNVIRNTRTNGIRIGAISGTPVAPTDIFVEANQFYNCVDASNTGFPVIYAFDDGAGVDPLRLTIRNNKIYDDRSGGDEADIGIGLSGAIADATKQGYRICDNDIAGPAAAYSNVTPSYTGTLTGCTTAPTASIKYTVDGDRVTLEIPSFTATSNTTACTITGMPASIRPASAQPVVGLTTDNGTDDVSKIIVETNGTLTLHFGVAATFTGSGSKGTPGCIVTYRLAG